MASRENLTSAHLMEIEDIVEFFKQKYFFVHINDQVLTEAIHDVNLMKEVVPKNEQASKSLDDAKVFLENFLQMNSHHMKIESLEDMEE